MQYLSQLLDHPEKNFPSIHIAGTNGKGSTAAMLESVYRHNGLKVGMFTSPHLVYLGERVQVNRVPIPVDALLQTIGEIRSLIESEISLDDDLYPSFFEFLTAVAFCWFAKEKVDIAVIETGLGGRLDSTNILKPICSVITSIGLDHCDILGNTLEEIATEKAGIIKMGVPVVIGDVSENLRLLFREIAYSRDAPIQFFGDRWKSIDEIPKPSLLGDHQLKNTGVAVQVTEILGEIFPVNEETVKKGLLNTSWSGRWEQRKTCTNTLLILDATHNEDGLPYLEKQLNNLYRDHSIDGLTVITGVMGEARAKKIVPLLSQFATNLVFVVPNQPKACSFETLKRCVPEAYTGKIESSNLESIILHPNKTIYDDIKKPVLVTGSIYLLGEFLNLHSPSVLESSLKVQDLRK
jgi:dihydrofolate synthase/folylpolyglutamate synthase